MRVEAFGSHQMHSNATTVSSQHKLMFWMQKWDFLLMELDDTERNTKGFGSSNTEAQGSDDQSARPKIQINEISARAFGRFYRRGEQIGILRWDEVDNEIQL